MEMKVIVERISFGDDPEEIKTYFYKSLKDDDFLKLFDVPNIHKEISP